MKFHSPAREKWFKDLVETIRSHYDSRLISLAVFGSYARGENRLNSDLDLLIVLQSQSKEDRRKRHDDFIRHVEIKVPDVGIDISSLIIDRKAAEKFNPLYLDMTEHCILLYDRDSFLKNRLEAVSEKMKEWGSRKIPVGNHWSWHIKPGLKWGETIDYDQ